jgi:hypothetical protein
MKIAFVISLFITLCKGGAWIGLGLLLRDHFDSFITLVTRRNVPEDQSYTDFSGQAMKIIKLVGLLFVLLGIAIMVMGVVTVIVGSGFGLTNAGFKF